MGNDKRKEIQCEKDTTDKTKLICTPDENNMPNNESYKIYYENVCGQMELTMISVTNKNAASEPEIKIDTTSSTIKIYKLLFIGLLVPMM